MARRRCKKNRDTRERSEAAARAVSVLLIASLSAAVPALASDGKWKTPLDGGCAAGTTARSEPIVSDGTVYVGSGDGAVYALDLATGRQKWRFQTGEGLTSGPEIIVAPRATDAQAAAGAALDEMQSRPSRGKRQITAAPAVDGGMVYIGSWDHKFYALEASRGHAKWTFDAGLPVAHGAVVHSDRVIFATGGRAPQPNSGDGLVYALDLATGSKVWVLDTTPSAGPDEKLPSHAPLVRDGIAYVTGWSKAGVHVHAVDAHSGRSVWSVRIDGAWPSPLSFTPRYVLFTTTTQSDGSDHVGLHALDRSTGQAAWTYEVIGGKNYWKDVWTEHRFHAPLVWREDVAVLVMDDGVIGLDLATGKERWRLAEPFLRDSIQHFGLGALAYVSTGDTFAPLASSNLYAIDPLIGRLAWSKRLSSRSRIRSVLEDVVYVSTGTSLAAFDGPSGRPMGTVWGSRLPFSAGSHSLCSGPVLDGDGLLVTTERLRYAGQPDAPGHLYRVAAPKRPK